MHGVLQFTATRLSHLFQCLILLLAFGYIPQAVQAEESPNRLYSPVIFYYGELANGMAAAGDRTHTYDQRTWSLWSSQAGYCGAQTYQTTAWGYLISMSFVPASSSYYGTPASWYCVTPQPLPNGAIPMWFPYGFFWLCPEDYIRDIRYPNESPRACYYDSPLPPTPPVDPDQTPGDPGSPDSAPPSSEPDMPDTPEPDPEMSEPESESQGSSGPANECEGVVGDPINTAHGNKFVTVTDYAPAGSSQLHLTRYYDSQMPVAGSFGTHWRHDYERRIEPVSTTIVKLRRADGKAFKFTFENGAWKSDGSVNLRLESLSTDQGWKVVTPRQGVELYDAQGYLVQLAQRGGTALTLAYDGGGKLDTVTDRFGRQLKFEYDAQGRVSQVVDPAGKPYRYTYDVSGNLSTRVTPDNRSLTYLYQNPGFPHALTAVVDGNNIQTDTTFYDARGRVFSNERNVGLDKISIAYGEDGTAAVTGDTNVTHSYTFQLIQGVLKATGMTRSCPTCGTATRSFTRDANGNITSRIDYNGIKTTYQYDLTHNLEVVRTEAEGSPVERIIRTDWHPTFLVPVKITEPGRITDMDYDDNGNMTVLSVTDTESGEKRTWAYGYDTYGLMMSRELPGGERIIYAYDSKGLLSSATTAGGLLTQYMDYDAHGHVGKIVYSSGRSVTFTYDEVGRVLARAERVQSASDDQSWWQQVTEWLRKLLGFSSSTLQAHGESGTALTRYTYDNAGLLTDIILPDGETLHYEYDTAYRLILARDVLGNTIQITRDPYGKPLTTHVTDGAGTLALTLRRTYDELGRLAQMLGNNGQQLLHRYDEEGYLLEQVNAQGQRNTRSRDARYRTSSVTDADQQTTRFEFDPLDQLTRVTDARGSQTRYDRNAFGEVTAELSPDRGNSVREFENARLKRITDARGITHEYTYDTDGRVLTRISPNGQIAYRYDEGEFGMGRLAGFNDASGSTSYRYHSRGQVAEKTSIINQGPTLKISYGYTLGGKLKEMATPGKHLIQYGYDAQGRISQVTVDGQSLLGHIRFSATGITGWMWANGDQRLEHYDQDGRIARITSGHALAREYGYDTANRLTSLLDTKAGVNDRYGYDAVGRLTSQQSNAFRVSYRYDSLGNRTQKQATQSNNVVATSYAYAPHSNQLLSETTGSKTLSNSYLSSGQLSGDGAVTYRYNDEGRLIEVGGQRPLRNVYNALGQRVRKVGQGVLVFVYDEAGRLIGEYTPGGVMVREYVWLGQRLVGMLSQQEKGVLYVHTDHLGTPRAVSEGATVLWRWEGEAFGHSRPNEQVAGPSRKFTLPLRFPGQYYDQETGLFYNYYRDYNPQTGRYIESDPIGLIGGLNSYAYVGGNPVGMLDQFGLAPLTDAQKDYLAPYIPARDLNNADVHVGEMPWYAPSWAAGITRGDDIYFRDPSQTFDTPDSMAMLGHELVHTGQYADGMNWLSYLWESRNGYDNNPYEKEAYAKGDQISQELKEKYGDKLPCP